MSAIHETQAPQISIWNNAKLRGMAVQAAMLAALLWLGYELFTNAAANLSRLGKTFGYGFWRQSAGFDIIQTLVPYSNASTYGTAIVVGFLNTLLVAVLGIIFATVIGFVAGIARLSRNWLIAKIAMCYVESIRNVPLLLQLFIWYKVALGSVPENKEALNFFGIAFLSKKGLTIPAFAFGEGAWLGLVGLAVGIVATMLLRRWALARQAASGQLFPYISTGTALIIFFPLLGLLLAGWPLTVDYPVAGTFRFTGGATVVPEFVALLVGLSVYTGTFIAEIVRSGLQAVSHGQSEAGIALGLPHGLVTRLVVIPQAMRIIIPPLANQYLNLTKNSSLAVAIGYPDLVATGGTVLNQTGKAIEIVLIWMSVYLSLSLATSAFMNWFNNRFRLVER
jgi:general L-amino acid transport system permease protein